MIFDVIAVNIETRRVRLLAENKDERNADAIICMAIARRGVDTEIYVAVPAGRYKDGDGYAGGGE